MVRLTALGLAMTVGACATVPSEAPVQDGGAPTGARTPPAPQDNALVRLRPVAPPAPVVAAPLADDTPAAQAQPASAEQRLRDAEARVRAGEAQPDLWSRIRAGYAMPPLETALVQQHERYYVARKQALAKTLERGGRYLYFIVEELERRGMPAELALLPFIESSMNPMAVSPARAAGMWQFIPSTGKQYNLSQNWWADNRRDVIKSTHAALDYLQRIYEFQGNDWFLALASYNWGEGSVQRAMKKNAARGLPTDYVSLSMPEETRHYVPKLIALRNVLARADELGIALPPLPNKPYFTVVEKTRAIDLKLAAKFAGMTVEEFLQLNPAHNRPVIAATSDRVIVLPTDRVERFVAEVEAHARANKPLASWQPVQIRPGETLREVAKRSGVEERDLRKANSLPEKANLLPGTRILAPQEEVADESLVQSFVAPRLVERVEVPAQRHVVGKTEDMQSIATRYGVTVAALKAWNGLKDGVKNTVRKGVSLVVRPAASQTVVTTETGERQVVDRQVVDRQVVEKAVVARAAETETPPARPAGPAAPMVKAEQKAADRPGSGRDERGAARDDKPAARADKDKDRDDKPAAKVAKGDRDARPAKVASADRGDKSDKGDKADKRARAGDASKPARDKDAAGKVAAKAQPAPKKAVADAKPPKAPEKQPTRAADKQPGKPAKA